MGVNRGPLLLIALWWAVTTALFLIVPQQSDDYWYMEHTYAYADGRSDSFPWDAIATTLREHAEGDNIRLANVVTTFMLLAPYRAGMLLAALLWTVVAALCCYIAGTLRGRGATAATIIVLALLSFLLPWHEGLFTLCFSMNYSAPTAMGLAVMAVYLRPGTSRARLAGVLTCALLCGLFHEGVALCLATGLAAAWIFIPGDNRRDNARRLAIIGALVAGAVALILTPGPQLHIAQELKFFLLRQNFMKVAKLQLPLLIYIALLLWACRRGHPKPDKRLELTLVCAALASCVIMMLIPRGYRVGWWAFLAPAIGIPACLISLGLPRMSRRALATLTALIAAVLVTHYAYAITYTVQLRHSHEEVLAALRPVAREHPEALTSTIVYTDCPTLETMSLWAWRKPNQTWDFWTRLKIAHVLLPESARTSDPIFVLPTEMKTMSPRRGRRLPGTAGAYELAGKLYMPVDTVPWFGGVQQGRVWRLRKSIFLNYSPIFRDVERGERWTWITPFNTFFPAFLMPLTELDSLPLRKSAPSQSPSISTGSTSAGSSTICDSSCPM